jgi:hypothetical protein
MAGTYELYTVSDLARRACVGSRSMRKHSREAIPSRPDVRPAQNRPHMALTLLGLYARSTCTFSWDDQDQAGEAAEHEHGTG